MVKKIGLALAVVLVVIQFIPMIKNQGQEWGSTDITTVVNTPEAIKQILHTSCNDCHSNSTVYPWYTKVQPFGFWINHHVEDGVRHLNFSEFAKYTSKRKMHKLDEVVEMLEEHEMPLTSYTIIHKNAVLTSQQTADLITWAKQGKQQILTDSLSKIQPIL
jgi:hypothetical protein